MWCVSCGFSFQTACEQPASAIILCSVAMWSQESQSTRKILSILQRVILILFKALEFRTSSWWEDDTSTRNVIWKSSEALLQDSKGSCCTSQLKSSLAIHHERSQPKSIPDTVPWLADIWTQKICEDDLEVVQIMSLFADVSSQKHEWKVRVHWV